MTDSSQPSWITWPGRSDELSRLPVVILQGGTSSEREISLRSGAAVRAALESILNGDTSRLDSVRTVEVDARGRWVLDGQVLAPGEALDRLPAESLFMLALHGGEGEDGHIQEFLRAASRRYTGSGPSASALCMDKVRARECALGAGLTCAPAHRIGTALWHGDPEAQRKQVRALGAGPWFAKPNQGGSSVGVQRVKNMESLSGAVESILASGDEVLVEQEITGLEVTVGVLGGLNEAPVSLPLCEIVPARGPFFDYLEKYSDDGAHEHCPPRQTPPTRAAQVQNAARDAFVALGCEGYARVDFILPQGEGPAVFLEANTLPGLTERSLLPLAANAAGISMDCLCLEIIARAL